MVHSWGTEIQHEFSKTSSGQSSTLPNVHFRKQVQTSPVTQALRRLLLTSVRAASQASLSLYLSGLFSSPLDSALAPTIHTHHSLRTIVNVKVLSSRTALPRPFFQFNRCLVPVAVICTTSQRIPNSKM